jgi:uncharacterized membrane protein/N-acetylneuraminic acid mutarotase
VALDDSRFSRTISLLISVWILYGGMPVYTRAAVEYEVIDLGTLGGDRSVANFINSAGQIVGWASTSQGFWRATTFDVMGDGNSIDLGTLSGDGSMAHSINSTGQIVGWAHDNHAHQRAAIFDSTGAGNNIDLGTLGGDESRALSINDAGQIVGEAINNQGTWRATLFDPTGSGNNLDLNSLGSYESWANSINSAGRIVGAEEHEAEEWSRYHAMLFDPTIAGNNTDLGTLGGDWSMAYSINGANQIVGAAQNNLGFWRATLFDLTGAANNIDLGTFDGNESKAYSINNVGQIVGGASSHAILFDPTGAGNNVDLNSLIDPACGWVLMQALCISDTGWIVGEGWNPEDELHAFLLVPQPSKYSGGTGEPTDPYQIATAEDLMLLGDSPEDYDRHFVLTADIDLDPNLPGWKVFERAIIAPDVNDVTYSDWGGPLFEGRPFTGVFDGNGHTISHLTINGAGYLGLFGLLDYLARVSNLGLEAVNINGSGQYVGGLVGANSGSIVSSYSTGSVSGTDDVGGLVGVNWDCIFWSYSTGSVSGTDNVGGLVGTNEGSMVLTYSTGEVGGTSRVGGLVGDNHYGSIVSSYSIGPVGGNEDAGGLAGGSDYGRIIACFWDTDISNQIISAGGIGKTTIEMQTPSMFLEAGWDFLDEVFNGTCDYWQMQPGDYPRLRSFADYVSVILEGSGTAENPYLIRNARDLGTVWSEPRAHYRLEASVDLSGITWSMAVVPWFEGTFDGNGHVISNLHIQGAEDLGLFGRSIGSISNVGLEAVDVNGTDFVGGLVGTNYGNIVSSYSNGTVSGEWSVGGLAGENIGGSLEGEDFYGNPIISLNLDGSISSSYSNSAVNGNSEVGGLVGFNAGSILSSYSNGTVEGEWCVGGLVGYNFYTSDKFEESYGTISGESYGSISSSYSTGSVSGNADMASFSPMTGVGGLVGYNEWGHVTDSYSSATVTGGDYVGGLVGKDQMGSVSCSYGTGSVSGGSEVGGLVGSVEGGNIVWSCSTGSVSGTGREVGGLVGSDYGGLITTSYSTGEVTGGECVGGLVGRTNGGCKIVSSYSTGAVSGISDVGGLVGGTIRASWVISSYSTGAVRGTVGVGGLAGRYYIEDPNEEDGISPSFWDIHTSGQTTSAAGVPKTTAEMKDIQTFVDAGWDFETVWTMTPGEYPRLERRGPEGLDSNGWVRLSPMKIARDQFAGALIGDEIFVFGGNAMGGSDLYSGEKYDIATDTWSDIADNPYYEDPNEQWRWRGVEGLSGIGFNGKFYVFGASNELNYNEMYDPATNTWTTLAKKPTTTCASIPVVYEGRIYLFGGASIGKGPNKRACTAVEAYDPDNDERESLREIPKQLTTGKTIAVHGNCAYLIGGYDLDAGAGNYEVMAYDFETDEWIGDYNDLPSNTAWWYSYVTQAPVVNGKVYLIGGAEGEYPEDYWISDKFTILDIESKKWDSGPALPKPRDGPLIVISNNMIYVIGGTDDIDNKKDTVFALRLPVSP